MAGRAGRVRLVRVRHGLVRCGRHGAKKRKGEMDMIEKKYSWRKSHGVDAQTAGKVMEQIEERDGEVTKESLLEEARDENSPIHNCFEWNDGIAAERWRLDQARHMIQDLQVEVVQIDEAEKAPAFVNVSVRGAGGGRYKTTAIAMVNEDERRQVLQNAIKDLEALQKRHATLVELSAVYAEVRKVRQKFDEGRL